MATIGKCLQPSHCSILLLAFGYCYSQGLKIDMVNLSLPKENRNLLPLQIAQLQGWSGLELKNQSLGVKPKDLIGELWDVFIFLHAVLREEEDSRKTGVAGALVRDCFSYVKGWCYPCCLFYIVTVIIFLMSLVRPVLK